MSEHELAKAKAETERLLQQFKDLNSHSFCSEADKHALVQGAYDLGLAFGNLTGKVEAAQLLLKGSNA